jgi:hypothetical protein
VPAKSTRRRKEQPAEESSPKKMITFEQLKTAGLRRSLSNSRIPEEQVRNLNPITIDPTVARRGSLGLGSPTKLAALKKPINSL